ncbi:MAG: hypothetical protein J2P19_23975, partial [Pseudonocardia sp.]|nr:hypothetical protein [Pseudonocardia sp.]
MRDTLRTFNEEVESRMTEPGSQPRRWPAPDAVPEDEYDHAMAHGRAGPQGAYRAAFGTPDLHALAFPSTPRRAGPVGMDETTAFDVYTRNTSPGTI